ncbi:hypothetical protein ACTFIY_006334 [Dictyostelium cf. discoideum]
MASSQLRLTKDRISRMDKEERLRLAVDHYKQNFENITQEEVGKHFDVPSYEISRKMNCTSVKKHNRLLLAEQEKSLLKYLEEIINNNIAVTKEMVLDMVLSLFKERTGITKESISNEWWREFKQRNPNIKLKNISFQDKIWDVVTTKQISPELIFNEDEKGVVFTKAKKRVIVIEKIDDKLLKENKTIALYKQKQNQHFTMVPWVNAMGQALNVYYILQMPDTLKMEITIPKHYGTLYINNSGYVVKYLSPDEKGKRHNITSEQYPFLCYRAWQESFTANNKMQAWSKVGFLNYSFTEPIDKRFLLKKKTQPPKPSNQLAVINTNQEIVVHTPIITKETISAMRKHKTDGCDLTSTEVSGMVTYQFDERKKKKTEETNKSLTLVQNNFQINNNNLIQISTPLTPTNLPQFNTTQQISTSQYSLSTGITNLDQKIDLAIKDILKKKNK